MGRSIWLRRRRPSSSNIDVLEAEMEAAFSGAFNGHNGVSSWDTDVAVTSPTALATQWAAIASSRTQFHRIRCNWTGLVAGQETTGISLNSGTNVLDNGFLDNGGGVLIVNETGQTPRIGGQVLTRGLRGVHFKGIHFTLFGVGANNTGSLLVTINGTHIGPSIVMAEDCTFGHSDAIAAGKAQWAKGIQMTSVNDELYVKNCTFNYLNDGINAIAPYLRVHGCDFKQITNDAITNFSFTNASFSGVLARSWIEGNTMRDWAAYPPAHGDFFQTGTSADVHFGYDNLVRKNVVHMKWPADAFDVTGLTTGGNQGQYNDDYAAGKWRCIWRNNIIAVSVRKHLVMMVAQARDHHYSKNNTLVAVGEWDFNNTGSDPAGTYVITGADASATGPYNIIADSDLYDTILSDDNGSFNAWDDQFIITNSQQASPLDVDISSGHAYEDIYVGTFTRDGSNRLYYTWPNETGTQAQFRAGGWTQFEPKPAYAGIGCPDPTSFGAP